MSAEPVIDGLLEMDADRGQPDVSPALAAIAAYADGVIEVTDGMWPPYVRASTCREGLRLIAAECRRGLAPLTTEEGEAACPPS